MRIAEFEHSEDAMAFLNMKGRDFYELVGGINLPWAVMQKPTKIVDFKSDEPPTVVPGRFEDWEE